MRAVSNKWDIRFLELAKHISGWSKDPSTKVGCVVVGEDREIRSTGFNGFPRGISDDNERLTDRNQKYPLICHAEENAIMHAARIGVSLKGSTAFVTWPPCSRCARSLIQAGIREVVYPSPEEIAREEEKAKRNQRVPIASEKKQKEWSNQKAIQAASQKLKDFEKQIEDLVEDLLHQK